MFRKICRMDGESNRNGVLFGKNSLSGRAFFRQ